uniref:Uncharacterized protein n=1 Tax=Avena sativa TaxID=4498 RepID=A0ACD5V1W5_AVESA
MARSHDDGGEGREATKALRGEDDRRVARGTGLRKKDKKRKRRSANAAKALPPPPAPSQEEHRATSSADDGFNYRLLQRMRDIVAMQANSEPAVEQCAKRVRVCSGFVMLQTDNTGTSMILTSATLVRSLNGDNNVMPNVTVKVLLSDGHITDGHIFLVDFHYNVAVVKVAADLALLEVVHLKGTTHNGAVLALGRAYEGGNLMCSRGQVVNQTSTFGCSELLVSSCKISMAGSGGPLVNYNGQVLGINFYEKNHTSYLPMLIVSRILEQHQSFGKTISPWLGLKYTSLHTMPLSVLERIYQKFPDVDQGLYISNVAKGSPADVAGLCNGDVLVECNEKVLPTAPEFGAVLLDVCTEHLGATGECARETMIVEVVIKRPGDGSTVSKTIAAEMLKESNYNRWPALMPSYKVRVISIGV